MLTLPEENRLFFKKPFGILFSDFSEIIPFIKSKKFYSVGDVVTENALYEGLTPEVAVIDGFTKRSPYVFDAELSSHRIDVVNPAGTITDELITALKKAVEISPSVIVVDGEEDLAVLPLVSLLKDGDYIIYGQPDEGVVLCEVGNELRKKSKELLDYFVSI